MEDSKLLSRFVLGTASFGNIYGILNNKKLNSLKEIGEILELFLNQGGYQIDTSSGYGKSEEIIGSLINDLSGKKIKITSKFFFNKNGK